MIKPLRKKHLQVWSLWAVLLPLGILAATLARHPLVTDVFEPVNSARLLEVVIDQKQVGQNRLQLRGPDSVTVQQLVWINREALRVPTATLYLAKQSDANISDAVYIGRIENSGTYAFNLPAQPEYHFLVYDFIRRQITRRISFAPHKEAKQTTAIRDSTHKTSNSKL